jgi:hypothetical protein
MKPLNEMCIFFEDEKDFRDVELNNFLSERESPKPFDSICSKSFTPERKENLRTLDGIWKLMERRGVKANRRATEEQMDSSLEANNNPLLKYRLNPKSQTWDPVTLDNLVPIDNNQ